MSRKGRVPCLARRGGLDLCQEKKLQRIRSWTLVHQRPLMCQPCVEASFTLRNCNWSANAWLIQKRFGDKEPAAVFGNPAEDYWHRSVYSSLHFWHMGGRQQTAKSASYLTVEVKPLHVATKDIQMFQKFASPSLGWKMWSYELKV